MVFREALYNIFHGEGAQKSGNPFWLYSRLNDLCPAYVDRQKIERLYDVDKRLHAVRAILSEGKVAVAALKAAYPAVKDLMSEVNYKELVDCLGDAAFKPSYKPEEKAAAAPPKQVAVKQAPPRKTVQKAVVKKAPVSKQPTNSTPLASSYAVHSGAKPAAIITGVLAALAVMAGIVCLIVFRRYISWTVWQYLIGGAGGLVLLAAGGVIAYLIDDALLIEGYKAVPIISFAVAVANFVLYCIFRENYKIIFIILSAFSFIGTGISAYFAFEDLEDEWGIAHIVEAVIIAAGLVLGLTVNWSWTVSQYLIGGAGGLALTGICLGIAHILDEELLIEKYKTVPFMSFAVAVANVLMYCFLRENYKIIFIFLTAFNLIGTGISAYVAFDDVEEGWGVVHVLEDVVMAAGLVLGLILL